MEKMTLNDAIKHLDDILQSDKKWDCEECRNEHVQLRDWLNELKIYKDLEGQGKLLKPECLPGDYVWEANKERNVISEYEVASIRYGINKTFRYMWTLRDGICGDLDGFRDDEIGKTVFLTREEAEAALKEEEA